MATKKRQHPSKLVKLTVAELAAIGHGKLGRFPASEIYAARRDSPSRDEREPMPTATRF
jgi:hypothetical protein